MFQSHLDIFLRSEPHTTRSYACVTESKAQMWDLHPHDTRSTRFEKKWRATFFQLTLCVVLRLLNSIHLAFCTLRLNFRDKRPIYTRHTRFSLVSSFSRVLDLFGQALHDLDG